MSLYDKASLVLIPSGTKTGTVYSQKPTDGDGDFTFTRSTQATRVNSQGLIEKERGNLVLYSNDFSQSEWVQVSTTRTSGQTGYDGTSDAWQLVRSSGGTLILNQALSLSGVYTFSCYVKINASNGFGIGFGSSNYALFNISDALQTSATLTIGLISSSITYVGDNFYRISVTADGTFSEVRFVNAIADGTSTTSAGGTHIVQDAQLEQGLVATDYIETTTAAVYTGITDNVPRLDYDGDCPSLLLEPQRTNVLPNSEYFAGYGNNNVNITTNYGTSPEGIQNSTRLQFSGSGYVATSVTTYTDEVSSIYIKGTSGETIRFGKDANVAQGQAYTLTGDWQRLVFDSGSGSTWFVSNYSGSTATDVEIYGGQHEEGSYATSYIPTHGTQVTRNMDSSTGAIANTSGDYWTLFIDYANYRNGGISGDDSMVFYDSSNVKIFTLWGLSNGFVIRSFSGDTNGNYYTQNSFGTTAKAIVRYDGAEIGLFVDGVKQTITSRSPLETNWNQLYKVYLLRASDNKYNFKQMAIFPTALSDQECIDLTT